MALSCISLPRRRSINSLWIGETPGWKGVEPEILVASEPTQRGGIRIESWNLDWDPEALQDENVRYTSGTTFAEFEGKTYYAVAYEGVEVLSADGRTVVKQAAQVRGIEVKDGVLVSSIGITKGSGETHRFTAVIEKDIAKNTQKQLLTEWRSNDIESPLNWAGVLSEAGDHGRKISAKTPFKNISY